jgi:hypothetical protein
MNVAETSFKYPKEDSKLKVSRDYKEKKFIFFVFVPFTVVPSSFTEFLRIFNSIYQATLSGEAFKNLFALLLSFSTLLIFTFLFSLIFIYVIIRFKDFLKLILKCIGQIKNKIILTISGGGRKAAVEIATVLSGAYAAKELVKGMGSNDNDDDKDKDKRRKDMEE